jgi:hypothetical protein
MEIITKYRTLALGVLAGGVGGYLYYHFIGCSTGSCPITSQPVNSTLYGAMMGGLLFSNFKNKEKKNDGSD